MKLSLSVLSFVVFSFAAAGCKSDDPVADFCQRITDADCTFSNGASCEDQFSDIETESKARGCDSELADYLDCAAGVFEKSCTAGSEGVESACSAQGARLEACGNAK